MQKLILDTNVIVSSLIQRNYPYLIVGDCIAGNVLLCLFKPDSSRIYRSTQAAKIFTV